MPEVIDIHPFDLFDMLYSAPEPINTVWDKASNTITFDGKVYRETTSVPYKGNNPEFLAVLASHKASQSPSQPSQELSE